MLFYVFLSEGKHLLMFNVQLCLTFERVSVILKFPLHSAIVTIVQNGNSYIYYEVANSYEFIRFLLNRTYFTSWQFV